MAGSFYIKLSVDGLPTGYLQFCEQCFGTWRGRRRILPREQQTGFEHIRLPVCDARVYSTFGFELIFHEKRHHLRQADRLLFGIASDSMPSARMPALQELMPARMPAVQSFSQPPLSRGACNLSFKSVF